MVAFSLFFMSNLYESDYRFGLKYFLTIMSILCGVTNTRNPAIIVFCLIGWSLIVKLKDNKNEKVVEGFLVVWNIDTLIMANALISIVVSMPYMGLVIFNSPTTINYFMVASLIV